MHRGAFGWLSFSPLITSILKTARGQEPFLFSVVILTWSFLQWHSIVPKPRWDQAGRPHVRMGVVVVCLALDFTQENINWPLTPFLFKFGDYVMTLKAENIALFVEPRFRGQHFQRWLCKAASMCKSTGGKKCVSEGRALQVSFRSTESMFVGIAQSLRHCSVNGLSARTASPPLETGPD